MLAKIKLALCQKQKGSAPPLISGTPYNWVKNAMIRFFVLRDLNIIINRNKIL